jgi:glucose-1-phosphate cytidylyltransferase
MKAVILAGGKGTRLREETEFRPKPMVEIGGRPILWHIMKHLSSFGITDFVVAAGYKNEIIKDYFLNYEARNNDFTIELGNSASLEIHGDHDEAAWNVTVADTGEETLTGGRVFRALRYVGNESCLIVYGDGLSDVDISSLLEEHRLHGRLATMTLAQPSSRFGVVEVEDGGRVLDMREKPQLEDWVNIGYFVLEPGAREYLDAHSALEVEPLKRLIAAGHLGAYRHHGYWQPMDTYKEAEGLKAVWDAGNAPWKTWGDSSR